MSFLSTKFMPFDTKFKEVFLEQATKQSQIFFALRNRNSYITIADWEFCSLALAIYYFFTSKHLLFRIILMSVVAFGDETS